MKRWTFRIVLCLLLGVVTTVAVAWGCSLWKPLADYDTGDDDLSGNEQYIQWWRDNAPRS